MLTHASFHRRCGESWNAGFNVVVVVVVVVATGSRSQPKASDLPPQLIEVALSLHDLLKRNKTNTKLFTVIPVNKVVFVRLTYEIIAIISNHNF